MHIRQANKEDAGRIAEIEIFNYRLYFYPIFRHDEFYFQELQIETMAKNLRSNQPAIDNTYVYDDGVIKGFIRIKDEQIEKLFVEPILHNHKIGSALLEYAVQTKYANWLWALEKNEKAISFYQRNGFQLTGERIAEDGTCEYLVKMKR